MDTHAHLTKFHGLNLVLLQLYKTDLKCSLEHRGLLTSLNSYFNWMNQNIISFLKQSNMKSKYTIFFQGELDEIKSCFGNLYPRAYNIAS